MQYVNKDYLNQSATTLSFLVDCQWGEYSAWSACTKTCGGGKQYKFRVVQTYETEGGIACDANKNVKEQDCNTDSCPGPGKPCSILYYRIITLLIMTDTCLNFLNPKFQVV